MAFEQCPGCDRSGDRAVYQCSKCGSYGCMEGSLGGYAGPYGGCWTEKECPNCGEEDTKQYKGRVTDG